MDSSSKNLWPVNAIFFLEMLAFFDDATTSENWGKKKHSANNTGYYYPIRGFKKNEKKWNLPIVLCFFLVGPGRL